MIVYQSTKQGFCTDIKQNRIADRINDAYFEHLGRHTSQSEYNSWKNSMMYMNVVMNDNKILDNAGISIEYQNPLTSNDREIIFEIENSKLKPSKYLADSVHSILK